MRDIIDFVEFMLIGLVLFAVVAAIPITGFYYWNKYQCGQHQIVTGDRTEYVAGACYVDLDGRMTRWDEYKMRVTASELAK